ncbi:phosphatidylinositol mannoside acyltransferase [Streptomyces odontomachi]|uniref:phosphatidylinositol mannoside acyltransferase n=1 Tax=Streptomyces odontomachi TaxID=2944940 RepID=UPI002108831E|nr:phosphatidylinositol mannoside acyltransferase [Streptomyces sp. ODS25]
MSEPDSTNGTVEPRPAHDTAGADGPAKAGVRGAGATATTATTGQALRSLPRRAEEHLVDALYGVGWGTVKRLPEPVAVRLGRTIADAAWKKRGAGVRRLESNLARVRPEAGPAELSELTRAGMRSYMRYWMESFRLPVWSAERIKHGFDPKDVHYLTDGLASDRGVILALPHQGNWDLAGAWVTTKLETPFTTVMERLKPETLYDRFVAYRASLGMEVLPHTGGAAFGTLARRLRAGGLVCLVADRDLSASGIEVSFFGERARMPAGPALLAQQTGALLLPVSLWYDETAVMQGRLHPPVEVPKTGNRLEKAAVMTQALADAYAAGIAEHPEDWHMLQRLWIADLDPAKRPAADRDGQSARAGAAGQDGESP